MAGEEPQIRRPLAGEEPIKYKDVFEMSGEMAEQPISPRDAAAMRSAENRAFGKTIKGGPASIMLSAAAMNLEAGLVQPDASSAAAVSGRGLAEGNQWHESQPAHEQMESSMSMEGIGDDNKGVTIGEALQATADTIGDKPVDRADATAIQAAEMIATGTNASLGSGLGAEAQASATVNALTVYDEDKTKLSEIIGGAVNMVTDDKPATTRHAEMVKAAELRGDSEGVIGTTDALHHRSVEHSTTPGGVAESVEAAARINEPDESH